MSDKPIDLDFLENVIGDDKEFERELCEIFIDNSAQYMSKMEETAQSGDGNGWYMASHAFKGASASIGAFPLSKVLETAQKSSEEPTEVKEKLLAEAKAEYVKVEEFIKKDMGFTPASK